MELYRIPAQRSEPGRVRLTSFSDRRDRARFAAAYADPDSGVSTNRARPRMRLPVCKGPLTYTGGDAIRADIAHMNAALRAAGVDEGFMTSIAPGSASRIGNEHYKTEEELIFACADAMREEYRAILDAGLVLQLDDPAIAENWDMINPAPTVAEYRKLSMIRVEALNHALRASADRIRFHLCWGSWHGPHVTDIPLRDIVDVMLAVNCGAYSFEAGNVRHEHEWKVWRDVKLPDDKILIPGVVSHATNVVEHPELVADRIVRIRPARGTRAGDRGHGLRPRRTRTPRHRLGEARVARRGRRPRLAPALWRSPMTVSQKDKALRFQALHQAPGYFVIPNPWDGASARILAGLGFLALATSSGAQAGTLGRRDGKVTRDEALAHARAIVTATDLPVAADLEKGFGDAPTAAAETIRLAAEAGLVGGSIEDATGDRERPLYDIDQATERVAAAVEAARKLPFPFTLTARSENFLRGNPSLDDTIRRLQAFERAGADVLFAPGLPDLNAVRTVCAAVSRPFNFMVGIKGKSFTVAELAEAGVKRISLATSLYRAAMSGLLDAAREVKDKGTFGFVDRAVSTPDLNAYLQG